MDLKRMLYFCTIAEQGQISRAARALHMAQPPLSQRLRELEEELGCELFTRQGRSLQLTEAGRNFYRRARDILRAVDEARDEAIRVASQAGPTLRIGLSPTCRNYWLARFASLQAACQDRQLGVIVGDSSYLEYLLQTGQLDLALMQPPSHPENFIVRTVATSQTVAVAPAGLLPPGVSALSLAELARYPLLMLRRSVGVGSYERLRKLFQGAGLHPQILLYSSDVELLLDLLRQGMAGVAVIPASETKHLDPRCQVVALDIDLPGYELSLVCAASGADEALLDRLQAVWQI